MNAHAAQAPMTIGDVLGLLRAEFPDITVSKIRFLESEGLIEPRRSPSGYRKFGHSDVERLRFILSAQRDHYLPLRVIKEHLEARDRGEPGTLPRPPVRPGADRPGPDRASADRPGTDRLGTDRPGGDRTGPDRSGADRAAGRPRLLVAADATAEGAEVRLTRRQLLDGAGIDEALLADLEQFGLVCRAGGGYYDGAALTIARTAAALGSFGVEARHLRAVKAGAEREIGLIEQVIGPLLRRRSPGAHEEAGETAWQIAALSTKLHAALVSTGLRESLNP